jgi:hypothetical protein
VSENDLAPVPHKIGIFRPAIDTNAAARLDLLASNDQIRSSGQSISMPNFTLPIDELNSPFVKEPEPRELSFMFL